MILRLAILCAAAALLVAVLVGAARFDRIAGLMETERSETRAWSVLARAETAALTTHRIATRLDVRHQESSFVFGAADSLMIATVEFEYGVDLAGIGPEAVTATPDALIVRLPPPRLLDIDIPLDSITYFETATGIVPLKDRIENRDRRAELATALRRDAETLARDRGLIPGDDAVRARIETILRGLMAPFAGPDRPVRVQFSAAPMS